MTHQGHQPDPPGTGRGGLDQLTGRGPVDWKEASWLGWGSVDWEGTSWLGRDQLIGKGPVDWEGTSWLGRDQLTGRGPVDWEWTSWLGSDQLTGKGPVDWEGASWLGRDQLTGRGPDKINQVFLFFTTFWSQQSLELITKTIVLESFLIGGCSLAERMKVKEAVSSSG